MTRPTSFTIILSALFCLSTLLLLFRAPTQSLAQISATNPWAAAPRRQDQPSQQTIPPAIVLTKTASLTMVTPGERVTYTIQVQNATTAALTIHLTDTLPIALHAVLMPPVTSTAPVQLGHLLTWTGIISQAQQVAIRYSAQVTTADVRQPITNQVVVQVNADQFFTTTASILTKRQLFMPLIQQARPPTPTPTATPPPPTLVNGNFEAGPHVGWTETSANFDTLIVTGASLPSPVIPRSPPYVAWLGGRDQEVADLAQTVAIPAGYPALRLRYYYWSASLDTGCAETSDVAYLKVNGVLRRTFLLCKSNDTNGWREALLTVAEYANQTVTLHFTLQLDGAQNSNFFIDDVAFCIDCGP